MGTETNLSAPSFDAQVTILKRDLSRATAAGDAAEAEKVRAELASLTGRVDPDGEPVQRAVKTAPEKATTPRKRATAATRK